MAFFISDAPAMFFYWERMIQSYKDSLPRPGSPNALWAKHGYTVERQPRLLGRSTIRTIRHPAGEVVLHDVSLSEEFAWI